MAMLQLGGTLSYSTVRINPRVSWWITAQQLLYVSSAIDPNPEEESISNIQNKKVERYKNKQQELNLNKHSGRNLTKQIFTNLIKDFSKNESDFIHDINTKIKAASNIDELLDLGKHEHFHHENAIKIINVLSKWIIDNKIQMNSIEEDPRYLNICKIISDFNSEHNLLKSKKGTLDNKLHVDKNYEKNTSKEIDKLNIFQVLKILSTLASTQKRDIPTIKEITERLLSTSTKNLNIKQLGDILYSMAVLSYYDEKLMTKISNDVIKLIPENTKPAIISSILKSIGFLRYKKRLLLDEISYWILKNHNVLRAQDISSLLMTYATLGYIPSNFDDIYQLIVEPLTESDMCDSKEWLDLVWALTVLNKASTQHYQSILNKDFLNRISVLSVIPVSKALRLMHINASARLLATDYQGPTLPDDSTIFQAPIYQSKDKTVIVNSLIGAIKIMLPSDFIYYNFNVDTKLGFLLDAEFVVDDKCTPLPLKSHTNIEKKVFRIAMLSCSYHEICRGDEDITGIIKFYNNLLQKQGYNVLLIPYTAVDPKDTLINRVKYINNRIKLLLQGDT